MLRNTGWFCPIEVSVHSTTCVSTAWVLGSSTGIWHHAAQLSCRIMLGGTVLPFISPVSRTGNQERVTVEPQELAQPPGSDSPHGRLSQKNPPLFLEQEAGLWKVGMRWKFSCLLLFTCWTASVQFSIWTCGRCCSCSSSSACAPATKVRTWQRPHSHFSL